MNIRQVEIEDLAACAELEILCFEPSEAASAERIRRRAELFPQGFLVAERGGALIGMMNSAATYKTDISDERLKGMTGHDPEGENLVVFTMAIDPKFQGQGYSRPLLERYIELARLQSRKSILLICKERLIPYYKHFGFKDCGPSSSTHGGFRWHQMQFDC